MLLRSNSSAGAATTTRFLTSPHQLPLKIARSRIHLLLTCTSTVVAQPRAGSLIGCGFCAALSGQIRLNALTISEVLGRQWPLVGRSLSALQLLKPCPSLGASLAKASLFSAACLLRSFSTARAQAFGAPPAENLLAGKSGRAAAVIVFTPVNTSRRSTSWQEEHRKVWC
jgi:hypothetical protein